MVFENFEAIFNEAKPVVSSNSFLLYVHAPDPSSLRFLLTDFHFNTWEALRSVHQLQDLRDSIGIGGSWPEFLEYLIASFKSQDVKVNLEGQSNLQGATHATLVSQKSKGMPRISISLAKLVGTAAIEANGNLSVELFKSLKKVQNLLMQEQERSYQLTKVIAAEKEKNENIESQLDLYLKRPKLQKVNVSNKPDVYVSEMSSKAFSDNGFQNSPEKFKAPEKATNRVVPAYRRARARGVLLQDTEEEKDN